MALLQLTAATGSWLAIGAILYLLLNREVAFATVFGVFLVSAITAAGSHIPGGLGVLEGIFIVLLGDELRRSEILAALVVYRALYYIFPLTLAAALHFALEHRARAESDAESDAESATKAEIPISREYRAGS